MKRLDFNLLTLILSLTFFGIVVLGSASIVISQKNFGENYYYVRHQLVAIAIGFALLYLFQKINYEYLKKGAPWIFLGSIILMVLVFVPHIGLTYKGASRWINLGITSLQPAELFKIAFIIYFASWLDARKKELGNVYEGVLPLLAILFVPSVLLISQPDVGTLGVIIAIAIIMYLAARSKLSHVMLLVVLILVLFGVVGILEPYRFERLKTYFNPSSQTQGTSYQINQSLIAIGSGGFFGKGIGQSVQKYSFLPETIGDSIFAILAEELGFIGSLAVIVLFIMFLRKGFRIAEHAPDDFGKLLAVGLSSLIVIQAYVNIMSISGLIPLTGIPLPFFSYGGSAMVTILAVCGILLNTSKHTRLDSMTRQAKS